MAIGAIMGQQKANPQLSNLSNNQQALYNIGAGVRPNLLDNWYFAGGGTTGTFPINQRGQTSYAVDSEYSIDRWRMENYQSVLTLTLQPDCIKLQKTIGSYNPGVYQILSNQELVGKTATISVIYRGTGLSNMRISAPGLANGYIFQDSAEWTLTSSTYTIAAGAVGNISNQVFVGFQVMQATQTTDYLEVLAIKLELGENQTLAYQDANGNWNLFVTPKYGNELYECQRYYKTLEGAYAAGSTARVAQSIYVWIPGEMSTTTPSLINFDGSQIFFYKDGAYTTMATLLSVSYFGDGYLILFKPDTLQGTKISGWLYITSRDIALSTEP